MQQSPPTVAPWLPPNRCRSVALVQRERSLPIPIQSDSNRSKPKRRSRWWMRLPLFLCVVRWCCGCCWTLCPFYFPTLFFSSSSSSSSSLARQPHKDGRKTSHTSSTKEEKTWLDDNNHNNRRNKRLVALLFPDRRRTDGQDEKRNHLSVW